MSADLLVSVEDGVLRVVINRPAKRNPLSRTVLAQLRETFDAHRDDATLVLAVLRGAGEKSFAAGGDLRDFELLRSHDEARALFDLGNAAFNAIRQFPVPVVAALNGLALGGGAELAAACDYRIAAPQAKIGFVQGTLDIPTAWGGASDLAVIVGPSTALGLLADARVLDAQAALRMGLVDAVVADAAEFDAAVEHLLAPWRRQKPQVMRAFKSAVAASKLGVPREAADLRDRELFAAAWCHADHWAAAQGILDKEAGK
jgi:enoyl-CoA hydratase/carnithine racemase